MTYSVEQTAAMKDAYVAALANGTQEQVIEDLAKNLGKARESIVAKLAYEKVYVAKIRQSKVTGEKPRIKADYVAAIEKILEIESLEGLDKAPKQVLVKIEDALKGWLGE